MRSAQSLFWEESARDGWRTIVVPSLLRLPRMSKTAYQDYPKHSLPLVYFDAMTAFFFTTLTLSANFPGRAGYLYKLAGSWADVLDSPSGGRPMGEILSR